MSQNVIENEPPVGITLLMFWGLMWRTCVWILALLVPLMIIVFALSFFMASVSETQAEAEQLSVLLGTFFGWCAGASATCMALRGMMGKRFGGYRLKLVRDDAAVRVDNIEKV